MKYLNTEQAAEYLKSLGTCFSPGTLEVWRCLGKGPRFIRVRRKVFYSKEDLEKFSRGQVVETIDSI